MDRFGLAAARARAQGTVAISIVAAVGDFSRFDDPNRLVAHLGLDPRVRDVAKKVHRYDP